MSSICADSTSAKRTMAIKYNYKNEFMYIRISELPENQQEKFSEFMAYQTRPLITDDLNQYIEDAVYSWDYDRWVAGKTYWD